MPAGARPDTSAPMLTTRMSTHTDRVALAWRVVPVVFALFLVANIGALVLLGSLGGKASGERVSLRWQSSCAAQALPVMQSRGESLGLGEPEWAVSGDTITLTATMPGLDDDATAVPALLGAPGELELRLDGRVLATRSDLVSARLELDESGMPLTKLTFSPEAGERLSAEVDAAPQGEIVFLLDGVEIARRPNSVKVNEHQLRVLPGEGMTRERFRRATDWAIVLDHGRLPCGVGAATAGAEGAGTW